jgi:hypothetical protein
VHGRLPDVRGAAAIHTDKIYAPKRTTGSKVAVLSSSLTGASSSPASAVSVGGSLSSLISLLQNTSDEMIKIVLVVKGVVWFLYSGNFVWMMLVRATESSRRCAFLNF